MRKRVEWVLERYLEARNDDILLCALVWKSFYAHYITFPINNFEELFTNTKQIPKSNDIVRWRQKIQSEGFYLPTDARVLEKRKKNEKVWLKDLGYETVS